MYSYLLSFSFRRLSHVSLYLLLLFLVACRGEDEVIPPPTAHPVTSPAPTALYPRLYLLNEGNMGSNKATLDYLDYTTGIYHKNIFGTINPAIPFSLGDVGNDIGIYGDKLYAVINVSGLIEVMQASTGEHLGQIVLPNCRHLHFYNGKVYVTSYHGPVAIDPNAQRGIVAEIDTTTLSITRTTTVGYQPDGLTTLRGHLYVANSGGYRVPHYDHTISVIDLTDFSVRDSIPVAPNLNLLLAGPDSLLYVSARGDYAADLPRVYVVDPQGVHPTDTLSFGAASWWADGNRLYAINSTYRRDTGGETFTIILYDMLRHQQLPLPPSLTTAVAQMDHPYGIAVHPVSGDIYITEAKNYTVPGTLHCFSPQGEPRWRVTTGDIPAHMVFSKVGLSGGSLRPHDAVPTPSSGGSPYITRVLDYQPAPGQFVNTLPQGSRDDTQASMNAKVLASIGHNAQGLITLGGYGGYVVVGFDHTIPNRPDTVDLRIVGNAFAGSSEAGIVAVAYDANDNQRPDADEWYELAGSDYYKPTTQHAYTITYTRPTAYTADVPWTDNQGGKGAVYRNAFNIQDYYPLWLPSPLTFTGTLLASNAHNQGTSDQQYWVLQALPWGYVDNADGQQDAARRTAFDIAWAVDAMGNPVHLPGIDFVKIYTGLNQSAGWLGETSTEVSNVIDLHALAAQHP